MENIILLNIVYSASLKEKHIETYLYDNDKFIGQINEKEEDLKTKYTIGEEYTWHFTNNEMLQDFLDKELLEYYGKIELQTLSGYLVRWLNYIHTGISLRKFIKGVNYIGTDNRQYICLAGSTVFDSKWLQTETLREYYTNSFNRGNFLVPKGTEFEVMNWFQVETDIINIIKGIKLQDYIIENNKVIFR